ncbi:hypothetical protein F5Y14DRAFT_443279 [Nemania sp. NC0429]|nr:hypothetical protein F5Y14DRAFT_443279 [Nemania sp. NC0429]
MSLIPIWARHRRRFIVYAGILVSLLVIADLLRGPRDVSLFTGHSITLSNLVHGKGYQDPCASLTGLEDVFVIVRTGSNEVRQKLPALLNTTLPCFRHYGIWSDMEEEFAGQHIEDSLDEIDPHLLETHADFEYYRHLKAQGSGRASSEKAASWADAANTDIGRDTPAWKLDKWKFLPVAKKAYRRQPTSKWYVFVECDTYVFWASLLVYLSGIDAARPYYIGRQMNLGEDVFGYGGAGIIISNPAMQKLVEQLASSPEAYDELTIHQWAGDYVLSRAMHDAGVPLSPIWPTLEGEMPSTLNLQTMSTKNHRIWCYYAATYHHVSPEDAYLYYDFDQTWNSTSRGLPRHGDVFRHMVYPHLRDEIPDWDNLSPDVRSENVSSLAECRDMCEEKGDCVQFSLAARTCRTSTAVRWGKKKESSGSVDSGWIMRRVEAFMEELEASCSGEDWILP